MNGDFENVQPHTVYKILDLGYFMHMLHVFADLVFHTDVEFL